jgi:hypothetical protein
MRTVRITLPTPTTEVTLAPLGDIQWAGDRHDLAYDHLVEHLEEALRQPGVLFVGMGDYIDFASPSNRESLRSAKLYDTARKVIASATTNLVDDLHARLLAPTRSKWAGLVNGHHHHPARVGERETPEGEKVDIYEDSDVYLAKKLNAPFLEEFGIVKLRWLDGEKVHKVNVLVFHGDGSSVFPWGPLNKTYRISPNWNADIILMGHQTKKAVGEYDWIDPEDDDVHGDRLNHRTRHLVGTGGWGRGYVEGKSTYVSQAALPPVALGQPFVHIRPRYRTTTSTGAQVWEPRIKVES